MNSSVIIGRLTRDPEIRQGPKGEIASFTVAVDRFAKDDDADYIPVTCFGKQAEYVSNYLGKGRLVAVAGRIKTGSYEKDGQKRYTWEVVAQTVQGLDRPKEDAPPRQGQAVVPDADFPQAAPEQYALPSAEEFDPFSGDD